MSRCSCCSCSVVPTSFYAACVAAGVPISNHDSDLYVPVNEITRELIRKHYPPRSALVSTFICNITGAFHYDVAFAYQPYWDKCTK